MEKIKIVSAVMRTTSFLLCIASSVCIPIFALYALTSSEEYRILFLTILPTFNLVEKVIAITPFSIVLLFASFFAYFSYKFFSYLSQGEIFSAPTISVLKKVSIVYLVGHVCYFLSTVMISTFFHNLNIGENFSKSPQNFEISIVVFLLLFLFSWILEEGRKLKKAAGVMQS